MDKSTDNFRALLDKRHQWPGDYIFKFVVKKESLEQVSALFPGIPLKLKESAQGNYLSITAALKMNSSEEVLEIYEKASTIPGIIAL